MLQLKNIVKSYTVGDTKVPALRGIDLSFRENELVAILGPSGCGKTTLLNIIGGLDTYDSGDLIINGVSTKEYKDPDWDTYRNHSIGFIFQSYNLIPHQSVLANVELALTLSGVPKAERRRRATEALKSVGLGDQLGKKPNQMSGGQMQRVAVARALVNNPDILLADEPTGALDSETSIQLMDILKEISKTKLVIMVTHNPDLAERYATRIVRALDGKIVDDSNPPQEHEMQKKKAEKVKKPSMSFFTALSLSLNNLMTKKGRTFLTSFAGSIGIIGIALILALSNGVQAYINQVQEDTLSSYPITINAESVDMGSLVSSMMGVQEEAQKQKTDQELGDKVYSSSIMYDLLNTMNSTEITRNNLNDFRKYLSTPDAEGKKPLDGIATSIKYDYGLDLNVYTEDTDGKIVKSDVNVLLEKMAEAIYGADSSSPLLNSTTSYYSNMKGFRVWEEMLSPEKPDEEGYLINPLLKDQYDVLYGDWPKQYNEIVLVVNKNNAISDMVLYALGLMSADDLSETIKDSAEGNEVDATQRSWTFEDICSKTLKFIPSPDLYAYDSATGTYTDISKTPAGLSYLYDNAETLKISGIVRASKNAVSTMLSGSIGYTGALSEHIIEKTASSDIIKRQLASHDTDIITGLPFRKDSDGKLTVQDKATAVKNTLSGAGNTVRASAYINIMENPTPEYVNSAVEAAVSGMTREDVEKMMFDYFTSSMPKTNPEDIKKYISSMDDASLFGYLRKSLADSVTAQYKQNMQKQLSSKTADELSALYSSSHFTDEQYASLYEKYVSSDISKSTYDDNLDLLGYVDINNPASMNIYASTFASKEEIADVIEQYNKSVSDADKINYVDYVELLMSSITIIIKAISYVLMAFVSVSLIVSSIMIGIITYISVLERTKEIGILRSIGASKKDVKRVFNAETMIVGLSAGIIGILFTLLLCVPINVIIRSLTGIHNLGAALPPLASLILILISITLTLVAGLIPSAIAAKKDPVKALRTE